LGSSSPEEVSLGASRSSTTTSAALAVAVLAVALLEAVLLAAVLLAAVLLAVARAGEGDSGGGSSSGDGEGGDGDGGGEGGGRSLGIAADAAGAAAGFDALLLLGAVRLGRSQTPHATGHEASMYLRFFSHSPFAAHAPQWGASSMHGSVVGPVVGAPMTMTEATRQRDIDRRPPQPRLIRQV
jgi:hypothetical protein